MTSIIRNFDQCTVSGEDRRRIIIYCYLNNPPYLAKGTNRTKVLFHKGLPDVRRLLNLKRKSNEDVFVIFDDLANSLPQLTAKQCSEFNSLFVEVSRKSRISLAFIFQEAFPPHPVARAFIRNSSHVALFRFPTDNLSISNYLRRLYPSSREHKQKLEALNFVGCQKGVGGYLFIDTSTSRNPLSNITSCRSFVCGVRQAADSQSGGSLVCDKDHLYIFPTIHT